MANCTYTCSQRDSLHHTPQEFDSRYFMQKMTLSLTKVQTFDKMFTSYKARKGCINSTTQLFRIRCGRIVPVLSHSCWWSWMSLASGLSYCLHIVIRSEELQLGRTIKQNPAPSDPKKGAIPSSNRQQITMHVQHKNRKRQGIDDRPNTVVFVFGQRHVRIHSLRGHLKFCPQ